MRDLKIYACGVDVPEGYELTKEEEDKLAQDNAEHENGLRVNQVLYKAGFKAGREATLDDQAAARCAVDTLINANEDFLFFCSEFFLFSSHFLLLLICEAQSKLCLLQADTATNVAKIHEGLGSGIPNKCIVRKMIFSFLSDKAKLALSKKPLLPRHFFRVLFFQPYCVLTKNAVEENHADAKKDKKEGRHQAKDHAQLLMLRDFFGLDTCPLLPHSRVGGRLTMPKYLISRLSQN